MSRPPAGSRDRSLWPSYIVFNYNFNNFNNFTVTPPQEHTRDKMTVGDSPSTCLAKHGELLLDPQK
jgi:hypothetical protein